MSFFDITNGLWPNRNKKKTKASKAAKQAEQLEQVVQKRQAKYVQAHNQAVDTIDLRNQAQSQAMQKGVNLVTQAPVQRVALAMAGQPISPQTTQTLQRTASRVAQSPHVNPAMITALQNTNISPTLAQGVLNGLTEGKAEAAHLPPAQYAKPAVGDYLTTAQGAVGAAPSVAKLLYQQNQVSQQAVRFGQEKDKLHDVLLTQLAQDKGQLNALNKKGKALSGSVQASSPEELQAWLAGTVPVSKITPANIQFPIPGVPGLLPGPGPERLQATVSKSSLGQKFQQPRTPNEAVIQQLNQRDQRIDQLDQQLRQQNPLALQSAVQQRDAAQVQTVRQVGQAVLSQPREAVMLASNYLYAQLPKGPNAQAPFTAAQIQQAEGKVGHALGRHLADGHVESTLRSQIEVENLHAAGRPIAQELTGLHRERIRDIDRKMEIHDGEKFYDAFSAPEEMHGAEQFYEQAAIKALPRPEDALYLNAQLPRLIPNSLNEGLRRAYYGSKTTE